MGTASALNQIGAGNQALAQRMMDYDRGQFYEARDYPLQQFGLLQGILSGMPVGMTTQYPGGSRLGGIAGGAAAGYGVGGPFGALAGGLLGAF